MDEDEEGNEPQQNEGGRKGWRNARAVRREKNAIAREASAGNVKPAKGKEATQSDFRLSTNFKSPEIGAIGGKNLGKKAPLQPIKQRGDTSQTITGNGSNADELENGHDSELDRDIDDREQNEMTMSELESTTPQKQQQQPNWSEPTLTSSPVITPLKPLKNPQSGKRTDLRSFVAERNASGRTPLSQSPVVGSRSEDTGIPQSEDIIPADDSEETSKRQVERGGDREGTGKEGNEADTTGKRERKARRPRLLQEEEGESPIIRRPNESRDVTPSRRDEEGSGVEKRDANRRDVTPSRSRVTVDSVPPKGRAPEVPQRDGDDLEYNNTDGAREEDEDTGKGKERLREDATTKGTTERDDRRGGADSMKGTGEPSSRRKARGTDDDKQIEDNEENPLNEENAKHIAPPADDDGIDLKAIIEEGERIREAMAKGGAVAAAAAVAAGEGAEANLLVSRVAEGTSLMELEEKGREVYTKPLVEPPLHITPESGEPFVPRFVEEEGIYVGLKPTVPWWNVTRLEQRLLREDKSGKIWFGIDGRLNNEPDPLKPIPERPARIHDPEAPHLRTHFIHPILPHQSSLLPTSDRLHELDIDILEVQFYDHPLFIEEDLLASQLHILYAQYLQRAHLNLPDFYSKTLKGLQETYKTVKASAAQPNPAASLSASTSSSKDFKRFQSLKRASTLVLDPKVEQQSTIMLDNESRLRRLVELREKIRLTRTARDSEASTDNLMVQKMINIYAKMKRLRDVQLFVATNAKLVVKRIAVDEEQELQQEREDIEEELYEMGEVHLSEYTKKMDIYNQKMDAYREALRSSKNKKPGQPVGTDLIEPEKPEWNPFDVESARNGIITNRMQLNKRKPGAPILIPVLTETANMITPLSQCPAQEQQRRRELTRQSIYLRICVNGQLITRTRTHQLDPTFRVEIKEAFALRLAKWPDDVSVQIWNGGGGGAQITLPLMNSALADVKVNVPVRDTAVDEQTAEFTTQQVFSPAWDTGVSPDQPMTAHYTSGAIRLVAAWVPTAEEGPAAPPVPPQVMRALSMGPKDSSTPRNIKEWLGAPLDPNDPRNTNVTHLLKRSANTDSGDATSFSLEPFPVLDLTGTEETSKRNQLLQKRKEGKIKLIPIPLAESEITEAMFEEPEPDNKQDLIPEELMNNPTLNETGRKLREALWKRVSARAASAGDIGPQVEDIITLPKQSQLDIKALIEAVLRPRRKLNPPRKERKPVTVVPEHCKLVIQVNRAYNVPSLRDLRKKAAVTKTADNYYDDMNDAQDVNTYVEVRFNDEVHRTRMTPGNNPQWNETVYFPLTISNPPKPSLEPIIVSIIDEAIVDLEKDDRDRDSIYQRVERRWLGYTEIPFPTVFYAPKVAGNFRLNVPEIHLGYKKGSEESGYMRALGIATANTTLSFFATLDPPLMPPEEIPEKLKSLEDKELVQYAAFWKKKVKSNANCAKRDLWPIVVDLASTTLLITRYIRPQEPPAGINTDVAIIRYVSLIPLFKLPPLPSRAPIWASSQHMLDMGAGTKVEHAILLCNYLLYLKKVKVHSPESIRITTKMVLVQDGSNTKGKIWANLQPPGSPFEISLSFKNNTSVWSPFFTPNFPLPELPSLQEEQLNYESLPDAKVQELQSLIESSIRDAAESYRAKRYTTQWNRLCNRTLRDLLAKCESDMATMNTLHEEEHMRALQEAMASYSIHGFPFHTTFTSFHEITQLIMATNIFHSEDSRAEFSLAVKVEALPGKICSVWIYVASLIPTSGGRDRGGGYDRDRDRDPRDRDYRDSVGYRDRDRDPRDRDRDMGYNRDRDVGYRDRDIRDRDRDTRDRDIDATGYRGRDSVSYRGRDLDRDRDLERPRDSDRGRDVGDRDRDLDRGRDVDRSRNIRDSVSYRDRDLDRDVDRARSRDIDDKDLDRSRNARDPETSFRDRDRGRDSVSFRDRDRDFDRDSRDLRRDVRDEEESSITRARDISRGRGSRGLGESETDNVRSRTRDDVPRRGDDVSRRGDDLSRRADDVTRRGDDAPRRGEDVTRREDDVPRRGNDVPGRGEDVPRRGGDLPRRGDDVARRGDDVPRRGRGDVEQEENDDDINGEENEGFISKTPNRGSRGSYRR